jgi:hypothetical protein
MKRYLASFLLLMFSMNPAIGRAGETFRASHSGLIADGVSDNQTAAITLIASMPPGSTLHFDKTSSGIYSFRGGMVINKSMTIACEPGVVLQRTGIARSSVFWYMGNAVPNGTPNPDYAPGAIVCNAGNGALAKGQTTFICTNGTEGFHPGNEVFMGLGLDPNDYGQHYTPVLWNKIESVRGNTLRMRNPIPEAIPAFVGKSFGPKFHEIVAFPRGIAENFRVIGCSFKDVPGPAYDNTLFFSRTRNVLEQDIDFIDVEAGSVMGQVDGGRYERIRCEHCRNSAQVKDFVSVYGSRNIAIHAVKGEIAGTGIYIENQCRGIDVSDFMLEESSTPGTSPMIMVDGSKGVQLRHGRVINDYNLNALPLQVVNRSEATTEDVSFSGLRLNRASLK